MLLNNAKLGFFAYQLDTNTKFTNILNAQTSGVLSPGGTSAFIRVFCGGNVKPGYDSYLNIGSSVSFLDIGFSDDPESVTNYKLGDGNYANPRLTVVNYNKNTPTLGEIFNQFINVRNDGNTNVVVKEIGILGNPTGSSSSAGNNTCLIVRKVLETPVTIAPGETYSFNYILKFKN